MRKGEDAIALTAAKQIKEVANFGKSAEDRIETEYDLNVRENEKNREGKGKENIHLYIYIGVRYIGYRFHKYVIMVVCAIKRKEESNSYKARKIKNVTI